ncbi:MAG: polysaccharide pyruvyl transferase family protein [Burkholderiales bacterium]|nr:polysaccharide pyruvyl transferase family protein [Burkholderiales bacterium]
MLINSHEWNDLYATLNSLKKQNKIKYIPNGGNAGDGVIAAATWQLFERLDILSLIEVGGEISTGDVVIYAGGGNLIPEYDQARKVIEKCLEVNISKFILLPHSIRGNEDLLQKMDERFYLFCREQKSFSHVGLFATRAQAFLTHDLVFGLDFNSVIKKCSNPIARVKLVFFPNILISYIRWRVKLQKIKPQYDNEMHLMRVDVESKYSNKYSEKYDLSSKHSSTYVNRLEADVIASDFLSVIDRANHIVSDRLHVCISAALLGKKVTMLDNSYGKNFEVYTNSIQKYFPNVTFVNN